MFEPVKRVDKTTLMKIRHFSPPSVVFPGEKPTKSDDFLKKPCLKVSKILNLQ
jgi:hypothetical protein